VSQAIREKRNPQGESDAQRAASQDTSRRRQSAWARTKTPAIVRPPNRAAMERKAAMESPNIAVHAIAE